MSADIPNEGTEMETESNLLEERMEEGTTSTTTTETCHDEVKTYEMKELEFLKMFIILGVSQHTDPNLIVKVIDVLNKMLEKGEDEAYKFMKMLREISEGGHNIGQNAIFLCLVKCYLHKIAIKVSVSDVIASLCRIPTHLFLFLKMLKEYIEKGEDTAEYYQTVLKGMGSNVELAKKNKGSKPSNENKDSGIKISSFIPKHKFISKWYTDPKKTAQDLLLLLTKYPKRYGWDHKTLCKYTHVKISQDDPELIEKNIVIQYHLKGFKRIEEEYRKHKESEVQTEVLSRIFKYIEILEEAKKGDTTETARLITDAKRRPNEIAPTPLLGQMAFTFNTVPEKFEKLDNLENPEVKLTRLHLAIEHLPQKMYKEKEIWDELITDMPMTAMLKHISHMSNLGLFEEDKNVNIIQNAFSNEHRMYPFTHPFQILKALIAYQHGSSWYKDQKKWNVNSKICAILKDAFYLSLKRKKDIHFENCLICIDASEQMNKHGFLGFQKFTAVIASVAVATTIEEMGKNNNIFICGNESKMLEKKTLMEKLEEIKSYNNDKTNLSQPIREACEQRKPIDTFIIFTMSRKENIHGGSPYEAYNQYKEITKKTNTKLVICSMEATNSIIADPDDPNVITVCGADADILPEIYKGICSVGDQDDSMEN